MVKQIFQVKNKTNETLVGDLFKTNNSDKVIIVIHSYASDRRFGGGTLAKMAAEQGHNVISFDLSGNGDSLGDHATKTISDWVNDILCIIDYATEQGYNHFGMITTSMGNMSGLIAASKVQFDKIFCWGPSLNFVERNNLVYDKDWDKDWKEKGYKIKHSIKGIDYRSNYTLVEDARNYNFRTYFPNIEAETLFCYGAQDNHVAPSLIKEATELMPNATALVFEGVGHNLTDQSIPLIHQAIKDWFINF